MRTGGQVLADALVAHGSDLAFCVPGESYLGLLDGLYEHRDALRIVNCRHEGAAANAADAYGKLTGRPGLCFVTRGPGATHAATGIHTARQDSTPLIMLVGQVARDERGRESFQELDYEAVFGPMAKWAFELDDPARIPEVLARAYTEATSGRPGPVVLSLPEDVLAAEVDVADAPRYRAVRPVPSAEALEELGALLEAAERPFVLVGGGPWDEPCAQLFTRWAVGCGLPVGATFRRQDVVDNLSPSYAGDVGIGVNPNLAQRIRDCDLLVAVGTRLAEIETQGYTLPAPPVAPQPLVHVHPDPGELGRVYQANLPILAGVRPFAAALEEVGPVDGARWAQWARDARADYEANLRHDPAPGEGVDLGAVMAHLREALPQDAIVCNGAGNYTVWVHRFLQYRRFGTQLAPQSGSMGYGLPAAVAAQLVHPDRLVVAFAGDGCLQMCAHELATAVQEGLPIVVIVVNNGMLATIRMHQERRFPRRVMGTDLVNPDFVALARAYGAHGERVEHADGFPAAFARAREAGRPALVELVTDPEALTPRASLSAIRAQGERGRPAIAHDSAGRG
jgi:acetolactate synthase I/II/III large subunit